MDIKEKAMKFLQLAGSGEIHKVYHSYLSKDFVHHNPFFASDGESLTSAMEENASRTGGINLEIKNVVREGNLVVVHSKGTSGDGKQLMALVHIFRFEGGMIAEAWDIVQQVPEKVLNEKGMF